MTVSREEPGTWHFLWFITGLKTQCYEVKKYKQKILEKIQYMK